MINAGKYSQKITIHGVTWEKDEEGYKTKVLKNPPILTTHAEIKTTKGMTIIRNNSDFERALTRFTIRYPKAAITREMVILFRGIIYSIEYLNRIDEESVELEIQAKEVSHDGSIRI